MSVYDLGGVNLRIVTQITEWVTGNVNPTTGLYTGAVFWERTLHDLQILSNFRASLAVMNSNSSSPDYFAGGPAKLLADGLADLSVGVYYVTHPRVAAATPLMPIHGDGLYAYFVSPSASTVRNIYFSPLRWPVLLCWVVTLIVNFILGFVSIVAFKGLQNAVKEMSLGIFSKTVGKSAPFSLRTGLLSVSYLSLFLSAIYTAKLLWILVQPTYPIQDMTDLIKTGYTFFTYPNADPFIPNGVTRKSYDPQLGAHIRTLSFAATFQEKHAHVDVGWESFGGTLWPFRYQFYNNTMPFPQTEMCKRLSSVPVMRSEKALLSGFFVAVDSPFRNIFNHNLLKIKEVGLLWKYINYPVTEKLHCTSKVRPAYQDDLGFDDVSSAFIFLLVAFFISIIALGVEHVESLRQNCKIHSVITYN